MEYIPLLILVKPHGEWLVNKKKTAVVKSVKFKLSGLPMYIVQDKLVYGKVILGKPREINRAQFDKLSSSHKITQEERLKWWPGKTTFYYYPLVDVLEVYDPPKRVEYEPGPQVLVHDYKWVDTPPKELRADSESETIKLTPDNKNEPLTQEELFLVTPEFVKGLSDNKLHYLHLRLHATNASNAKVNKEDLYNAHKFVAEEKRSRGIRHREIDELDQGLVYIPQREGLPDVFPIVVIHDAVSLAGSMVYLEGERRKFAHDADIIIRHPSLLECKELYEHLTRLLHKEAHPVLAETGPNWDYVPLGDLVLAESPPLSEITESNDIVELKGLSSIEVLHDAVRLTDDNEFYTRIDFDAGVALKLKRLLPDKSVAIIKVKEYPQKQYISSLNLYFRPRTKTSRESLEELRFLKFVIQNLHEDAYFSESIKPGEPFKPMKAAAGYHEAEFTQTDELWNNWALGYIDRGIVVQRKFDGIRMVIHRSGDRVWIFTEDKKRDRADIFPAIVSEIKKLPHKEIILDTEFVWWDKETNRPKDRWEMTAFVVSKTPFSQDEDIRVYVHDILYLDGKDLTQEGYLDRIKLVHKTITGIKYLNPADYKVVFNRDQLNAAIRWASTWIGSEGAMLKVSDSKYDLTGESPQSELWAKFKVTPEIKVQVIGISRKPLPQPAEGRRTLSGDEALKVYKKLSEKSETVLLRCAILHNGKLTPIITASKLTPAELQLRLVVPGENDPLTGKPVTGERPEWRGTQDPRIWKMAEGWPEREVGEYGYATTYAAKLPGIKLGDIVTVAPGEMRKISEGMYTWMFPRVKEIDPTRDKPDTSEDADRIVKATLRRTRTGTTQESLNIHAIEHSMGISKLIPSHTTYVELSTGSKPMLFSKLPSNTEILHFSNPENMELFEGIKTLTENSLMELEAQDWSYSLQRVSEYRNRRGLFENIYRWIYGKISRVKSRRRKLTREAILNSLKKIQLRLMNTALVNTPVEKLIEDYDSTESFYYYCSPTSTIPEFRLINALGTLTSARFMAVVDKKYRHNISASATLYMRDIGHRTVIANYPITGIQVSTILETFEEDKDDDDVSNTGLLEKEEQTEDEGEEEIIRKQKKRPPTREEQRQRAEKILGDWYMIEQPPGESYPFVAQWHIRGLFSKEQLNDIKQRINSATSQEDIDSLFRDYSDLVWIEDFEKLKQQAQSVDDQRGDVSGAIRKYLISDPPKLGTIKEIKYIGSIASVHLDLRLPHPSMDYLSKSWTNDVTKTIFQDIDDNLHRILRDRLLENQDGDNWLSQKKCDGWLESGEDSEILRGLRYAPDTLKYAIDDLHEAYVHLGLPGNFIEAIQPLVWLMLVSPRRKEFYVPPGEVGATVATAGKILFMANGKVVYGVSKSDFHEHFLFFDNANEQYIQKPSLRSGRFDWKKISGKKYEKAGEEFWMGSRPWTENGQVPYIMTHDFFEELEKAKKEKIQMNWNSGAIVSLMKLEYQPLLDFLNSV